MNQSASQGSLRLHIRFDSEARPFVRHHQRARTALSISLERLTSGVRINRAADDAAGLAVSSNLRTDQKSGQMALRNVHDAMEMATTAESGLVEVADLLQRMRSLAVAGASETIASEERSYLQDEYGQLLAEIDRIANTTTFGSKRLLAPKAIDLLFMIDTSSSMGLEIPAFRTEIPAFRQTLLDAGLDVHMGLAGVSNTVDFQDGTTTAISLTGDTAAFDSVLSSFAITGVGLMDPYSTMLDQTGLAPLVGDNGPERHNFRGDSQKVLLYAADIGQETSLSGATETSAALALADAGYAVHVMTRAGFEPDYDEITTATGGLLQQMSGFGVGFDVMLDNIAQDIITKARPVSPIEVQAGIGSGAEHRIEFGVPVDVTTLALGVNGTDVATLGTARGAIDLLDTALDSVGRAFAAVGAGYNRLESAADHQEQHLMALAGAESAMLDADYAYETSAMTAAQIVEQAGIAVQAQATDMLVAAIPALLG